MSARLLLLAIPGAVAACVAWGGSWTNQAGHVIEGEVVAVTARAVTLTLTNGTNLEVPLSALREGDRARAREAAGESTAPVYAQAACRDARALLRRYDNLPPGERTTEERKGVRRMALAVFDERIAAHGVTNLAPEARAGIDRLRETIR